MNGHSFNGLRADIKRELADLRQVVEESQEVLRHAEWPELAFKRTLGSLLHDFYTRVEKVFQRIALQLDGDLPAGPDWHIQLLRRMITPIDQVRPAVLDRELAQTLEEYLRFRHVFRAVYGFELGKERLRELARGLPQVLDMLETQLGHFLEFLEALDKSAEGR
jgi:hypothetical protein